MLLTDTARYMSLAAKTLKELYPTLIQVTCIAHLPHNSTIRVCAFIKNIDDVVATIKAATIKNKDRKNDFREAGLPSPPVTVITDEQLGLELHYTTAKPILPFVPLSTIGQMKVIASLPSRAKIK